MFGYASISRSFLETNESEKGKEEGGKEGREGGREGIHLGDVNGANADQFGSIDPECHGEGVKAHGPIALDGLEVVDDSNAEPGQTRERGKKRGRERWGSGSKD